MDIEIQLANEAETVAAGERLGRCLEMATVVYLDGDLGAGKTTFAGVSYMPMDTPGP